MSASNGGGGKMVPFEAAFQACGPNPNPFTAPVMQYLRGRWIRSAGSLQDDMTRAQAADWFGGRLPNDPIPSAIRRQALLNDVAMQDAQLQAARAQIQLAQVQVQVALLAQFQQQLVAAAAHRAVALVDSGSDDDDDDDPD
jgi:hypothetical protein